MSENAAPDHGFSITHTEADVQRGADFSLRHAMGSRLSDVLLLLLAVVVGAELALDVGDVWLGITIGISVMAVALIVLVRPYVRRTLIRRGRTLLGRDGTIRTEYRLFPNRMEMHNEFADVRAPWQKYSKLICGKGMWFLYDGRQYGMLPTDQIPAPALEYIHERLCTSGVRIVGKPDRFVS